MLRRCLPTKFNLHSRGVPCQIHCILCSREVEDEMHLFLDIAQVVHCWKEANLWHKVEHIKNQSGSFSHIIFAILTSLNDASCTCFAAVLWSIWRTRNVFLWEHKPTVPTVICKLAMDMISDCSLASGSVYRR
ncbi:ribonuclease H protein, partial [Trifolium medium]|nr:ribonuclease H protein [Trifolium medium]